jgi:hypothetical protein
MQLGEGSVNLINVYDLILTPSHLALVMEVAEGNSLTSYVADKWQHADPHGLVLDEDEGRFYFKVSNSPLLLGKWENAQEALQKEEATNLSYVWCFVGNDSVEVHVSATRPSTACLCYKPPHTLIAARSLVHGWSVLSDTESRSSN